MEGAAPEGGGAAGVDVFSCVVVVDGDGVGLAGAELDAELRPAKELVYVLERHPWTSRLALQAYSNDVVISAYSL